MPLRRFSLSVLLFLALIECGLAVWRNTGPPPSTDPVFTYPPAASRFDHPGELAGAIAGYQADRGAECQLTPADGTRITVLYFEWDRIETGPLMSLAGHSPDECNVAMGYSLKAIEEPRQFEIPGKTSLIFDCTRLEDGSGRPVVVFKMAWVQGLGSRQLREGSHRVARLENSFIRHIGAARVLEAGVFGAHDSAQAWQVFQNEVLSQLAWKELP